MNPHHDKEVLNLLHHHKHELLRRIQNRAPNIEPLVYPKDLRVPAGYEDPRMFQLSAFTGAFTIGVKSPEMDVTCYSLHVTTCMLIRYQVPTFFVSDELCEALLKTEAPQQLMFSELMMPMPAMLFMLPDQFSRRYFGWPTPYLTASLIPQYSHFDSPILIDGGKVRGVDIYNPTPFFCFTMMDYEKDYPFHYDARSPIDHPVSDLMSDCPHATFSQTFPEDEAPQTREQDKLTVRRMTNLAINILLAMNAEPELVTREHILVPTRKKGDKVVRRALWKPNMIGEHFRIAYERDSVPRGTHQSPHAHWRRGHWRNQRKGPQLSITERIWLKPVFIGLKGEK